VWAERRARARLAPMLQSIASEFDAELGRTVHAASSTLRIDASHGYAIVTLRDMLTKRDVVAELYFRGSAEALASLCRSSCDLAGFHVPVGAFQAAALETYVKWLRPRAHKLLKLITRRPGIMVAKGNPKGIASIADLARSGVSFVDRQSGSGTRFLLDALLKQARIESAQIDGYDRVEFTHDAVAAYIASGMAEAGLGIELGARRLKLDFVPLAPSVTTWPATPTRSPPSRSKPSSTCCAAPSSGPRPSICTPWTRKRPEAWSRSRSLSPNRACNESSARAGAQVIERGCRRTRVGSRSSGVRQLPADRQRSALQPIAKVQLT